jgi:hypothetical protein
MRTLIRNEIETRFYKESFAEYFLLKIVLTAGAEVISISIP